VLFLMAFRVLAFLAFRVLPFLAFRVLADRPELTGAEPDWASNPWQHCSLSWWRLMRRVPTATWRASRHLLTSASCAQSLRPLQILRRQVLLVLVSMAPLVLAMASRVLEMVFRVLACRQELAGAMPLHPQQMLMRQVVLVLLTPALMASLVLAMALRVLACRPESAGAVPWRLGDAMTASQPWRKRLAEPRAIPQRPDT